MKQSITFIVLILGVLPAYAERYSSSGEAFLVGALQCLLLMFVFWIYRLIKGIKSKSDNSQENENIPLNKPDDFLMTRRTPWEKYKLDNPEMAKYIEKISNTEMRHLSEKSIFEKELTLKKMATRYNCSIPELKEVVIRTLVTLFNREELQEVITKLTEKSKIESHKYGIAENNTMSYYIHLWLTEYLKTN